MLTCRTCTSQLDAKTADGVCDTCRSKLQSTAPTADKKSPQPTDWPIQSPLDERYDIEAELGAGGMGRVYRAYDQVMDRRVAIKVLRAELSSHDLLERFQVEARAQATLDHPNVVGLRHFERATSTPYLVMEYVDGPQLTELLPLPPREAAAVVADVGRGLAAAHAAGILHRDLKPGNVLMAAGRKPKLADFGLAKRLRTDDDLTETGRNVLGTPGFAAPEQFGGQVIDDPRIDVWGLGAILYTAVTGVAPLAKQGPVVEPPPARWKVPDLHPDLDAIIGKCLRLDPTDRYPSVAAVADELDRYLRGEPTLVRPATRFDRACRWLSQLNPGWKVAGGTVVACLAVVVLPAVLKPPMPATTPIEDVKKGIERVDAETDEKKLAAELAGLVERFENEGKIEMVGASGLPVWSRVGFGPVRQHTTLDSGDAYFEAYRAGLVLFESPGTDFVFEVEIRHVSQLQAGRGRVGLFFGQVEAPQEEGPGAMFLTLDYGDYPRELSPPTVALATRMLHLRPNGVTDSSHHDLGEVKIDPAAELPGPWRKVRVSIKTGRLQAEWYPSTAENTQPVQVFDNSTRIAKKSSDVIRETAESSHRMKLPAKTWRANTPIGIFVDHAGCSYRNAKLLSHK